MNKIIIKGRITATPEIKTSQSGKSICNFAVAVNRRFNRDATDFLNCVAFGKTAELVGNYFQKGSMILLCGELHIDKYEKNGEKKTAVSIAVDEVEFCGNKSENTQQKENVAVSSADFEAVEDDEDLPF